MLSVLGVQPKVAVEAWLRATVCFTVLMSISGCAVLPASAPTIGEVEMEGRSLDSEPFVIVDVDRSVAQILSARRAPGFSGQLETTAPKPQLRISVGDVLQINVLEQAPSGLFTATPGTTAAPPAPASSSLLAASMNLQPVQVEADGTINVPYAGRVVAAGRPTGAVRSEIERKLESKAIFPQVQLMIASTPNSGSANSASVGGEVNRAGLFALQPSGNRLLDMIAQAGGARYPAYETKVILTRRGQKRETLLQSVIETPRENVFIYPHDDIYLTHYQRTFTVLGASSKVGRYAFETARLTLAEAVAIGGGFVDAAADPAGVYVFRYEPTSFLSAIKPELGSLEGRTAPVLYRVNLRGGQGYFLSAKFEIQDKDIVLLANSDGAQMQKLLNLIQTGASIALTTKTVVTPNSVVLSTIPSTSATVK